MARWQSAEEQSPRGQPADVGAGPGRIHGLDALRAAALLLGIVLHSLMPFVPGVPWMIVDQDPRGYAMPVITVIHLFRMPLFLLFAGYFGRMVVGRRGALRYLRERTVSIALPAWVFWPLVVLPLGLIAAAWYSVHGLAIPAVPEQGEAFSPGHLWFLWTLYHCVLALLLVRLLAQRAPEWTDRCVSAASAILAHPSGFLVPAGFYFATLLLQRDTYVGITQPPSYLPDPVSFVAYASAYATGWLLHTPGALARIASGWRVHLAMAVVGSVTVLALSGMLGVAAPGGVWNPVLALVSAVTAWAWVYGLIGWGTAALTRERRWIRYLADASYWMYLTHLPLLVGVGACLTHAPVPAEVKLLVTLMTTTALLLLSYDAFVRSTWIGAWLNGRKRPRALLIRHTPAAQDR